MGVPREVTVEGSPSVSEVIRIRAAKHLAVELWIYDGAVRAMKGWVFDVVVVFSLSSWLFLGLMMNISFFTSSCGVLFLRLSSGSVGLDKVTMTLFSEFLC